MPSLGPKQKRPRSEQSQYQYTDEEKLTTNATNVLRREIKQVKNQEVAKVAKRLKSSNSFEEKQLEKELAALKAVDNQIVMAVCFRRLGLANTGMGNDPLEKYEKSHPGDTFFRGFTEKLLSSSQLCSVMDNLNKKVTNHRRKMLAESEKLSIQKSIGTKKRKKNEKGGNPNADSSSPPPPSSNVWSKKPKMNNFTSQSGVFLSFDGAGGASALDENDSNGNDDSAIYGPGGGEDEWTATTKSKNRKGQRARRAKAQAMEARSKGKKWNSSVNWREKKDKKPSDKEGNNNKNDNNSSSTKNSSSSSSSSNCNNDSKKMIKSSEIAESGKDWKDKKREHPSWLAKQSAKKTIAEFQGKKTTFNNDDNDSD